MPKVLLVDNDNNLVTVVTDALSALHIEVNSSSDGLDAAEKLKSFDAGADDYLPKPFNVRKLAMRVQALLRRGAVSSTDHKIVLGDLILDREAFSATRSGEKLELSRKEFLFTTES